MGRSVIIFLLVLASAWSAGGVRVSAADSAGRRTFDRVVTLGDSYSSGMGIHRDAGDFDDQGPVAQSFHDSTRIGSSACHRELDTTPGARLAEQLDADFVMVACAGARIGHIGHQLDAADIGGDGGGTLVTITVGGNDLVTYHGDNWPEVLLECITDLSCDDSDRNGIANLDAIERDLASLYATIGDRFPDMSVRVLGYPRLMQSDRWCEGVTGVNRHEADWIDGQVDALNEHIEAATVLAASDTGADIEFVSVVDAFDNHGSCRFWQRDRYVNDSILGPTFSRSMSADGVIHDHRDGNRLGLSAASFHPSQKGYDAYFEALSASVRPPSG
jgi:lysophospholipase L1-like esterase